MVVLALIKSKAENIIRNRLHLYVRLFACMNAGLAAAHITVGGLRTGSMRMMCGTLPQSAKATRMTSSPSCSLMMVKPSDS